MVTLLTMYSILYFRDLWTPSEQEARRRELCSLSSPRGQAQRDTSQRYCQGCSGEEYKKCNEDRRVGGDKQRECC